MSKTSTKPPSGTRDFLPVDIARRRHVVSVVESVYAAYGFQPLETPAMENLSVLLGKYGDEGDQLLFRLLHRRDALARALARDDVTEADLADQGLRYALTVPLARVVAEYGQLPRFWKRYQIQPVWRADRPGKGRYREFYQCDVDAVGAPAGIAEAEILGAVCEILDRLGFAEYRLQVNHREVLRGLVEAAGIPAARESDTLVALDKLDKIGREGVAREFTERGIEPGPGETLLGWLDADDPGEREARIRAVSPRVQAALEELDSLRALVAGGPAASRWVFTPELARGLGYYTGPIFEITVPDLAGSLGGGGRYDGLIGMFGKREIPAVGFSLGLERILLVLEERGMYPELQVGHDVMVCWSGVPAAEALAVARALRGSGLRVEVYPEDGKLGKQLQYADQEGIKARCAAIVGETEADSGAVTLKDMERGEQQTVPLSEAGEAARRILREDSR